LTDIGASERGGCPIIAPIFGSAPVSLKDYIDAGKFAELDESASERSRAAACLFRSVDQRQHARRLGPAINSGRGLFLFGAGNGKTSIAERVTRAFASSSGFPAPSASTARSFASTTQRARGKYRWKARRAC